MKKFVPNNIYDKDVLSEIPARFINELFCYEPNCSPYKILHEVRQLVIDSSSEYSILHEMAVKSKYSEIITTNYDVLFEKAALANSGKSIRPQSSERLHSLYRCKNLPENKKNSGVTIEKIWHPHGGLTKNDGIINFTLWNPLYLSNYQKICEKVFRSQYSQNEDEKILIKENLYEQIKNFYCENNSDVPDKDTWVKHFYFSDIDFIGYSLTFDEIDIWSILSSRSNYMNKLEKEKIREWNRLRFFMLADTPEFPMSPKEKATALLLEKMKVEVVLVDPNSIFEKIKHASPSKVNCLKTNRGRLYNIEEYYRKCFDC
ncbi:MAG: SIR2 family protein [Fibrobacter sp.]|nr:SIR2 family protein [Fibrobacter sp.]